MRVYVLRGKRRNLIELQQQLPGLSTHITTNQDRHYNCLQRDGPYTTSSENLGEWALERERKHGDSAMSTQLIP